MKIFPICEDLEILTYSKKLIKQLKINTTNIIIPIIMMMKVHHVMSAILDLWSPSSSFFILFFHIIIAPRIIMLN